MAKWTKRNNPHTWGRKKRMARSRTTSMVRYTAPRTVSPIIRVTAPRAVHKKHHRHKGGHGGALTQSRMFEMALGGAAFGFIEKSFGASLPTLPIVGRSGTIAIAAYFFGRSRGGIVRDVAIAAAVIAGYQIGSTGKIAGEVEGDIASQVSGVAAQV